MDIYIAHSTDFDFQNELYLPIRKSYLNKQHSFILPHESSSNLYPSFELLRDKKVDMVIAEISYKSTGMGIEIGWAKAFNVDVNCIYKIDNPSGSALSICKFSSKYEDLNDIDKAINRIIKSYT